jgi:RNA methyltransferase, TrmH family
MNEFKRGVPKARYSKQSNLKVPSSEQGKPQKYSNDKEDIIYGVHSAEMLFKKRPRDIKKVYLVDELKHKFSSLLRECSQKKIAYKIVESSALENISNSKHHEGICILARPKKILSQKQFIGSLAKTKDSHTIALLDSVQNPHNIGAIVRSMAHFGIDTLLVYGNDNLSLSGATYRVAEGGYEYVNIVNIDSLDKVAHELNKHGYVIHGTSSHTKHKLYTYEFPQKTVIIVGNEVNGMSKKAQSRCNEMLLIPGTGHVESLNVAQSLGLILGELHRQKTKI